MQRLPRQRRGIPGGWCAEVRDAEEGRNGDRRGPFKTIVAGLGRERSIGVQLNSSRRNEREDSRLRTSVRGLAASAVNYEGWTMQEEQTVQEPSSPLPVR